MLLGIFSAAWFVSNLDRIPDARDSSSGIVAGGFQAVPAPHACGRCGVIESVRPLKRKLNPPSVASVSSGQAGEIIAVLHMVMNAMVGNRSGAESRPAQSYEVVVRFHDGSTRTLAQTGVPSWKPGDPVKVINGRLEPSV
jgi:hypothetical protein